MNIGKSGLFLLVVIGSLRYFYQRLLGFQRFMILFIQCPGIGSARLQPDRTRRLGLERQLGAHQL